MLSYQHIYHAGCLADLHKHACLCALLARMVQKDKLLTYIETHAGRGFYDLNSPEAQKTGEAKIGLQRSEQAGWFDPQHPYMQAVQHFKKEMGAHIYPGSAALASYFLRENDKMHLHELHPQEVRYLQAGLQGRAKIYQKDGYEGLLALSPATPRRGMIFIDPSFELKNEYAQIPDVIERVIKKWPVAVICLWYPLLPAGLHRAMTERLSALNLPKSGIFETEFMPQKDGLRGMYGSGLFMVNMPFGIEQEIADAGRALHMAGA